MAGGNREGDFLSSQNLQALFANQCTSSGGKAKPLKAPKKASKDLDEDDIAFREKQKAGGLQFLIV